jgi:hypothetical protein
MNTIVVNRSLSDAEIIAVKSMMEGGSHQLISSVGLPVALSIFKLEPSLLSSEEKKKVFAQSLNDLLAFGDLHVDGKAVSRWLTFGAMPLWHYQRFRIYFPLRNLLLELAEIKKLSIGSEKVICYTGSTFLSSLPELPANLELHFSALVPKTGLNKRVAAIYACFVFIRFIIGAFQFRNIRGKRHLILDRSEKQICIDPDTLQTKPDNYNLSYLLNRSGKDFLVLSEVEIPKFDPFSNFQLRAYHFWQQGRMKRTLYGEYLLFKAFFSYTIRRDKNKILHDFDLAINAISRASLSPQERLIFSFYIDLRKTNSYFILKHLAYLHFFRKHQFITISSIDENSPSVRCILDAGRAYNSKVIGIQHGIIGDSQPAYVYTESDRQNCIMADHTLVWGEYWKEFMVGKGNFPSQSVHVIGQLRTDVIPRLREIVNSGLKHKLAGNKSLVVFASQPQPDARLRRLAALDVFNSVKDENEVFLIVKLHPAERYAFDYYHAIAGTAGCTNYMLAYDIDLYRLLAACDVLITCFSAVGNEAVYFNKPLIILDHNRADLLGYHAAGVAAMATGSNDLKEILHGFLEGKVKPDEAAYADFISLYAYRIDGHAVDRCLSFIRSLEDS